MESDLEEYPSFLDFVTSSDLLATVGSYLQCIPVLSATLPSGLRLVESNDAFDEEPEVAKDSQLYHIDYYSRPNVYVLVLLEDVTPEHGHAPINHTARDGTPVAPRGMGGEGEGEGEAPRPGPNTGWGACHPRGGALPTTGMSVAIPCPPGEA